MLTSSSGMFLGGFRSRAGTAADTSKARAARTLKANDQARSIAPIIDRVDPDRTASLRGIARALNDKMCRRRAVRGHGPPPQWRGYANGSNCPKHPRNNVTQ